MRRPLPFVFLFFSVGICVGAHGGSVGWLVLAAAGGWTLSAAGENRCGFLFCAAGCAGFLLFAVAMQALAFPTEWEGKTARVCGTVRAVSVGDYSAILMVRGEWSEEIGGSQAETPPGGTQEKRGAVVGGENSRSGETAGKGKGGENSRSGETAGTGKGGENNRSGETAGKGKGGENNRSTGLRAKSGGSEMIVLRVSDATRSCRTLVGRKITFVGKVERPSGARNPGGFDYALYLKSRQMRLIVAGPMRRLAVVGQGFAPAVRLADMRMAFSERLVADLGSSRGGMIYAMLFGDKNLLSEDLYEQFRRNGTAHILAVSGVHVGIVYLALNRLFAGRARWLRMALILGLLFLYAWLCGFSPSVMRALLMIATHMLAQALHRRYDFLSGIALAGVLLLAHNPYELFHPGFQLSFLAVLTLAFGQPFLENLTRHAADRFGGGRRPEEEPPIARLLKPFLPLLAIQTGMLPLTAYQFGYVSFAAFWVNLPVIALAGWLIPIGLLMFLTGGLGGPIAELPATAAGLLARWMVALNEWAADRRWAALTVAAPPAAGLALFYGAYFGLLSEAFWRRLRERRLRPLIAWLTAILIFAGTTFAAVDHLGRRPDLVFVDVGQGDCLHIRTSDGCQVLIDGGGSRDYDVGRKVLLPYLLKNGVDRIDLAIATHLHEDHFGGLAALCREIPVERLAVYEGDRPQMEEIRRRTGLDEERLLFVKRGDCLRLGKPEKQVEIEVLYPALRPCSADREAAPPPDKADENANGLVLRVSIGGLDLLMTGDLGFPGEQALMRLGKLPAAEVLKVGHHGSRFSTGEAFLSAVAPRLAVIQVGRNPFGHPHSEVIEKLSANDIMTVRTDRSGAVLFFLSKPPGRLIVKTMNPFEEPP